MTSCCSVLYLDVTGEKVGTWKVTSCCSVLYLDVTGEKAGYRFARNYIYHSHTQNHTQPIDWHTETVHTQVTYGLTGIQKRGIHK